METIEHLPRVSTWNTGALYTAEGQVMVAQLFADGRIIFRDFSRMIWGELKSKPMWVLRSDEDLRRFVDAEYLHNRYSYSDDAALLRRA